MLFVCDACHCIFQFDVLLPQCPRCQTKFINVIADTGRQLRMPAVRSATYIEQEKYQESPVVLFAEKLSDVPFHPKYEALSDYKLTDDEYHTALMLLFMLRNVPISMARFTLSDFLSKCGAMDCGHSETTVDEYLIDAKKALLIELNRERRMVETNNCLEIAEKLGSDSAAGILLRFRQSEADKAVRKVQNRGNIQRVNVEKVALDLSSEFIRAIQDAYNRINLK